MRTFRNLGTIAYTRRLRFKSRKFDTFYVEGATSINNKPVRLYDTFYVEGVHSINNKPVRLYDTFYVEGNVVSS